jgi:hypothetical protein
MCFFCFCFLWLSRCCLGAKASIIAELMCHTSSGMSSTKVRFYVFFAHCWCSLGTRDTRSVSVATYASSVAHRKRRVSKGFLARFFGFSVALCSHCSLHLFVAWLVVVVVGVLVLVGGRGG